jgi:hypothetical protein
MVASKVQEEEGSLCIQTPHCPFFLVHVRRMINRIRPTSWKVRFVRALPAQGLACSTRTVMTSATRVRRPNRARVGGMKEQGEINNGIENQTRPNTHCPFFFGILAFGEKICRIKGTMGLLLFFCDGRECTHEQAGDNGWVDNG